MEFRAKHALIMFLCWFSPAIIFGFLTLFSFTPMAGATFFVFVLSALVGVIGPIIHSIAAHYLSRRGKPYIWLVTPILCGIIIFMAFLVGSGMFNFT